MPVFENYPIAKWSPKGRFDLVVRFPVKSIQEEGGNRIVQRERPFRDGAKLDDTGSKAKVWRLEAIFENTIAENGLKDNASPLYPTMLNKLLESFDIHDTGDLVVPTRGTVRARATSYSRTEDSETRDFASVSLEFTEDNEDSVNQKSFTAPTANANARALGAATTFSAQSAGAWDASLQDLNEFAAGLEAIANYPGDVVAQVDSQAGIVVGAANRVIEAFTQPNEGRDILNDPESSVLQRKLERTKELAARARYQARRGRPNLVSIVTTTTTDIFRIAAQFGQIVTDLIAVNPALNDPLFIQAGETVYIFEQ